MIEDTGVTPRHAQFLSQILAGIVTGVVVSLLMNEMTSK